MTQSDIPGTPNLSNFRYENFLNVYTDDNGQYFYNLLNGINIIPPNTDEIHDLYVPKDQETWVFISYKYYQTIDLWWLICAYNQIVNPGIFASTGSTLKLLKSQYVSPLLSELQTQLTR